MLWAGIASFPIVIIAGCGCEGKTEIINTLARLLEIDDFSRSTHWGCPLPDLHHARGSILEKWVAGVLIAQTIERWYRKKRSRQKVI
jgi:hypothetical protein